MPQSKGNQYLSVQGSKAAEHGLCSENPVPGHPTVAIPKGLLNIADLMMEPIYVDSGFFSSLV